MLPTNEESEFGKVFGFGGEEKGHGKEGPSWCVKYLFAKRHVSYRVFTSPKKGKTVLVFFNIFFLRERVCAE